MVVKRSLIIVGVLAYLLCVIAMLPASLVWSQLEKDYAASLPVQVHGVGGSVWNGHATVRADQRGFQGLHQLQWSLKPARILMAKWYADVSLTGQGYQLDAGVWASLAGSTMGLSGAEGHIDSVLINALIQPQGAAVSGALAVKSLSASLDLDSHRMQGDGALGWGGGDVLYSQGQQPRQRVQFPAVDATLSHDESGTLLLNAVERNTGAALAELSLNTDAVGGIKAYRRIVTLAGVNYGSGADDALLISLQQPLTFLW